MPSFSLRERCLRAGRDHPGDSRVKKNRDDVKELCANIMEIVNIIQDQLSSHGDTAAVKFKGLCEDFESVLQGILKAVQQMKAEPRGFRSRFKEVVKLGSIADEISGHRVRIQELRSNFVLMAVIDINLHLHKAPSIGIPSNLHPIQVTQSITKCPPPSRIFHGRKIILDQMHQFLNRIWATSISSCCMDWVVLGRHKLH
ncbi:hypothetical protein B0H17DRAFT_467315 [Mycena rosella]|uniref:Uncharacterized protein n=1 Tax=Mycena rosella TaxID=1033263 RepID=A0AAD7C8J4_MYCRO|nr:hypothetical protein B0H17DRAFT_467315 [Mycena rosella]